MSAIVRSDGHVQAVRLAADWLCQRPHDRASTAIITELKARFNLTALETVDAIRKAKLQHARAS